MASSLEKLAGFHRKIASLCLINFLRLTINQNATDFTGKDFILIPILLITRKTIASTRKLENFFQWWNSFITAKDLQDSQKVFSTFNCQTLGDYHDLYLTIDTFLLACVFEEFRKMTFSTYGLGSAHYFTCSNLSGDAFLKVSNDSIELLTDREHLEIAETLIIGGSIFSKRIAVMNNEYLCSYDEMKAKTYGIMLDAKLLYGGII